LFCYLVNIIKEKVSIFQDSSFFNFDLMYIQ
jgi:hypothetical protein